MFDICIIGGGASGMTAAICAKEARPDRSVLIIEKKNQLGKKILATGNGKCNLAHISCKEIKRTLDFFDHLGLITRQDGEGRLYPYTEESRAVLEALKNRIIQLGIEVKTDAEVLEIAHEESFRIHLKNGTLEAKKVLIASGGKAGPRFGTTGDGYRWAKALGHRVEKPIPILTAVDVKEPMESLAGIRAKGAVRLAYNEQILFEETGEIQFTKTGLSGICIFNLTRYLMIPPGKSLADGFDDYRIWIDFFPHMDEKKLTDLLEKRVRDGFTGEALLQHLVRSPIGKVMMEKTAGDVGATVTMLKKFPLSPQGVKGWDFAQATKGGVSLQEINEETMESKLVPDLYFAGEVLDYDGPCGGYNLQYAWETGMIAGKEMAR